MSYYINDIQERYCFMYATILLIIVGLLMRIIGTKFVENIILELYGIE